MHPSHATKLSTFTTADRLAHLDGVPSGPAAEDTSFRLRPRVVGDMDRLDMRAAVRRRATLGELFAAVCGCLAVVVLFARWFSLATPALLGPLGPITHLGRGADGWHSLGIFAALFVAAALTPVLLIAFRGPRSSLPLPARAGTIIACAGAVATLLITYRIASPPRLLPGGAVVNGAAGLVGFRDHVMAAPFIALACAQGILLGGIVSVSERAGLAAGRDTAEARRTNLGDDWHALNTHIRRAALDARTAEGRPIGYSIGFGLASLVCTFLFLITSSTALAVAGFATAAGAVAIGRAAATSAASYERRAAARAGFYLGLGLTGFWAVAFVIVMLVGTAVTHLPTK